MSSETNRDDLILNAKTFIQNLSRIQEQEFQSLSDKLGFVFEDGYDLLFDYVYNCHDDLSFDEFLANHHRTNF